jgi:deaminated glutathione amidase
MHLRTAAIQLNSQDIPAENITTVANMLDQAGAAGAELAVLPELWTYRGPYRGYDQAGQTLAGPAMSMLQEKARQHSMLINGGSIIERHPHLEGKFYNTSVLIDRSGELVAVYRKIHLFDVDLANGEKHHESERIIPGEQIVTAETDGITFGMAVCYDLRFPELFRSLKLEGAQVLFLPAAFTLHTGRDHWEVLVRARAIENQCYVVAAGQIGKYPAGQQSFGRSMIVDPWGIVLAQAPDRPGVILADIDTEQIERVQEQIPCLYHRKSQLYRL